MTSGSRGLCENRSASMTGILWSSRSEKIGAHTYQRGEVLKQQRERADHAEFVTRNTLHGSQHRSGWWGRDVVPHRPFDGIGQDRPAVSARWTGVSERAHRGQRAGGHSDDESQAFERASRRAQRGRRPPCSHRAARPSGSRRQKHAPDARCGMSGAAGSQQRLLRPIAPSPRDVICPPYDSATSQTNRSDSREVILRFRELSREDQQAVIEFLKQL
jgi:hypothetical protein